VVKATGMIQLDSVIHLVREKLGAKLLEKVVEANVTAVKRAYADVVEG
jgi:Pyruvate/2-oxoacid:ferredoxin oxidoreductase gamma subunit